MAKRLKCIFNSVNGENTAVFTRTAMTKKSPSPGVLIKKNCPDGKTFYCDPSDGGTNNYYKLIDPGQYSISYNGTVYVWLDKSFLVSWTEEEYSDTEKKEEDVKEKYNLGSVQGKNLIATVVADSIIIYDEPSTSSKKYSSASKGSKLSVIEAYNANTATTDDDWASVDINGTTKWIQVKYCKYEDANEYKQKLASESMVVTKTEASSLPNSSSSSVWPSSTSGGKTTDEIVVNTTKIHRTSFFNDYSSFDSQLKIIEKNLNIGTRKGNVDDIKYDMVNRFNRFKLAYPDLQLTNSFSHVFFTRPDLNIYDDDGIMISTVASDPTFYYLNKNSPNLLRSLTRDFSKTHDFNPFLSNMAGSFELKDEVVQSVETAQTFTGHKMKYGRHNIESKTADSFSISYVDDQDYQIYKIHKAWTDYISKVYRGEFKSRKDNIRARVLDYACSVYYFLCAPDGETILFWTKYTGVFPTNTPSSASSWSKGSNVRMPDFTINYEYSWKEDFSPLSLAEFNINSKVSNNKAIKYAKTYENSITTTGKTFVGAPFIETSVGAGGYTFKLRFKMP